MQAVEDDPGDVVVGQEVAIVEPRLLEIQLRGVDQDLEVLAHERLGLRLLALAQLGEGFAERLLIARDRTRPEIDDLLVHPEDAVLAGRLRAKASDDLEQHLGMGVTALDPGHGRPGGRWIGGRRRRPERSRPAAPGSGEMPRGPGLPAG